MAKCGRDDAVHGPVSEVNCSGADVQVISCNCYLVVFHLFVEHLASHLLYQLQCACIICAISRLNADSAEQVYKALSLHLVF